jgi:hypothetical protein
LGSCHCWHTTTTTLLASAHLVSLLKTPSTNILAAEAATLDPLPHAIVNDDDRILFFFLFSSFWNREVSRRRRVCIMLIELDGV